MQNQAPTNVENPFSLRTVGGQEGPGAEHPEVALSKELLLHYKAQRSGWAEQAQEDRDFKDGAQWTEVQKKELKRNKQIPAVVNVIYPAVEQSVSNLTANSPRFMAVGTEVSDNRVAAVFSDLMQYIWNHSGGGQHLKRFVTDRYVTGMGVFWAYIDPYSSFGKGDVCISAVDPLDIYIDPNSKDFYCRDAAHILLAKEITGEQIIQMYPDALSTLEKASPSSNTLNTVSTRVGDNEQGSANKPVDVYHEKYEEIDRYTKIKRTIFNVYDPKSGQELVYEDKKEYSAFLASPCVIEVSATGEKKYIVNLKQRDEALSLAVQTGGVFHYAVDPEDPQSTPKMVPGEENEQADAQIGLRALPDSTIRLITVTMAEAIKAGALELHKQPVTRIQRVLSFGDVLYYDEVMKLEEYPCVISMTNHNRSPYPMSPVRIVKPTQELINKTRSLIMAHTANSTNVKVFLPRGSGNEEDIKREMSRAGTGVILYDAELGKPEFGAPVPLPNELYKNELDMRRDIQEILGVYTVSQGDPQAAPNTYKGTVAIDEYGQRRARAHREDVEAALAALGNIVKELIPQVYTEERIIRVVRPNNERVETVINRPIFDDYSKDIIGKLNDVTTTKVDITVIAGSTMPVNRWARFEYYKEMLELGAIDREEFLKQTELVDIEGVLARISEIEQLKGALAQAQEQIKGLQGDLQTAERESLHDRKRVEVEKFKSELADKRAKVSASTELFTARLGDELKKVSVAEKEKRQKRSSSTNR